MGARRTHSSDYIARIRDAEASEVVGEALFTRLATEFAEERAEKLEVLALLERETGVLLEGLLAPYGRASASPESVETKSAELASAFSGSSWTVLMERLAATVAPFVVTYDRLAEAARPADKAILSLVSRHERLLHDFFRAEANGTGDEALAEIQALIEAIRAAQANHRGQT
jgi:hypothetical protein